MLPARAPSPTIDQTEILTLRAECRAILWRECAINSLPEAVDPLQQYAEESGLVAMRGPDCIQKILADAFHSVRRTQYPSEPTPDVRKNYAEGAPRLRTGSAATKANYRPATSTIQAFEFLVQQGHRERLRNWLRLHTRDERQWLKQYFNRKRRRS